ncbi:hypothetical protein CDAR_300591 [Caerostris darwini]|uniref:Uncharacterized protein n=1 Tax=Caerostris darwini TaxID=1538125 RepID=A0AAV4RUM8_9ARAC|nr:hypothetical protein CDAR_300591 [Caerostris darwini]
MDPPTTCPLGPEIPNDIGGARARSVHLYLKPTDIKNKRKLPLATPPALPSQNWRQFSSGSPVKMELELICRAGAPFSQVVAWTARAICEPKMGR